MITDDIVDESYGNDPLLALMAARGELTEDDADQQHAFYNSSSALRSTSEAEKSNVIAGAAPYEQRVFAACSD